MNGTRSILDRIKNLISDDSKVLKDFNNKIEETQNSKNKAEEEKKSFEDDITKIQSDIDEITKASEIEKRFENIESYMPGLEKLGEAVSYLDKLKAELDRIPEHIEELENSIKNLTEKSDHSAEVIKKSEDELSKLEVDLSDAKRYQSNLVELIDLAKSGDINKTRDEVVETLVHVGFTSDEAINAAKIILFPEDDLIPYFEKKVTEKAVKEEIVEETPISEKVNEEVAPVAPLEEKIDMGIDTTSEKHIEMPLDEVSELNDTDVSEEDDDSLPLDNEIIKENIGGITEESDSIEEDDSLFDKIKMDFEETVSAPVDDVEEITPHISTAGSNVDKIKKIIEQSGLDASKFQEGDLNLDVDTELVSSNIDFILSKNISKDFIYRYPSLLSDKELRDKHGFIFTKLNKTEDDIRLTPDVMASYSLGDLEKLMDVVEKANIDPKMIPLTVYYKGLQPFLRNYIALEENHIHLDENELSKFAVVLSINPDNFKQSLQTLVDYKVTLKKNDGKIAIMCLTLKAVELARRMDMIIDAGEEDLIKYYPEVLVSDVEGLVNRLLFLKKSVIPYKTVGHNKTVYQPFVLKQEVLEKVLEKKVDLHELRDPEVTNHLAKKLINDDTLMDALDDIQDNFDLISNAYLSDHKDVVKLIKSKCRETDNSYIIDGYSFSKNQVNRNINYLLSTFSDSDVNRVILASLFYNSRLDDESMNDVINTLGIKVI